MCVPDVQPYVRAVAVLCHECIYGLIGGVGNVCMQVALVAARVLLVQGDAVFPYFLFFFPLTNPWKVDSCRLGLVLLQGDLVAPGFAAGAKLLLVRSICGPTLCVGEGVLGFFL